MNIVKEYQSTQKIVQDPLQISKERLNLALSAGNIAWWDMDCKTGKVEFNEHKVRMLGYSMDDFKDADYTAFTNILHPDDYEKTMQAMRDHLTSKKPLYDVEYRIKAKNGEYKWFYDKGSIFERDADGLPLRVKGIVMDITKRKNAEIALQAAHKELEVLNKRLEQKVNTQTKALEKLLEQQTALIVHLGHDLGTPLGPILNLVPVIENAVSDGKVKEMLLILKRNALVLNNVVKKTVKYARFTSSDFIPELSNISVNDLLSQVIKDLRGEIDEKNIVVENAIDPTLLITTDENVVYDIFYELLSNAVRFSKDKDVISINDNVSIDGIVFSVKDNGTGLSDEHIGKVFEPFYKTDTSRHDIQGNGLGLTITRCMVDTLGGRIWVESPGLGKGSTFYFLLPVQSQSIGKL